MKVKEFIQKVNEGNFNALFYIDQIEGDYELVEEHINLDEHRWYSTATDIYKLEDGFVGVRGLFQMFSELSIPSDFNIICEAFEMKAVPSVTYIRK